ncbi:hypothetical protein QBC46DRAFT_113282 [Diplogelasinospora grovesii]|uniref:Rhodopsin domain-containing protein n=1 Tax=Diplogelasinospora grovesii TaxID=303347 RepID=A0AAN6N8V1_9PEZI|nr:hypothetical protein QBC46DRAFT_113282 [Diplogelasinospora grovesii]
MATGMEDRGPELSAVNISFLVVAVIAISLRCIVRVGIVKAFGIDDWLMAFAACSFVVYCACSTTGVHYGTGRHTDDLPVADAQQAAKFWWLCYLFYAVTMIASKISIGMFLLRITVERMHDWTIYVAMGLSVITGIIFFFVSFFQCNPVSSFWIRDQGGTCINVEIVIALAYLYSAFSVISDFTFAILPIFLIWNLQMSLRTKLSLIPLLAMGCTASAAVVARFAYLQNFRDPDFLYATLDIAIWSTIEQGLAITAASLATLRPLLRAIGYKLGWSSRPSQHMPGYGISSHLSGRAKSNLGSQAGNDAFGLSTLSNQEKRHNATAYGTHKDAFRTDNESEEELRPEPLNETLDPNTVVVTTSFFMREEQHDPRV